MPSCAPVSPRQALPTLRVVLFVFLFVTAVGLGTTAYLSARHEQRARRRGSSSTRHGSVLEAKSHGALRTPAQHLFRPQLTPLLVMQRRGHATVPEQLCGGSGCLACQLQRHTFSDCRRCPCVRCQRSAGSAAVAERIPSCGPLHRTGSASCSSRLGKCPDFCTSRDTTAAPGLA